MFNSIFFEDQRGRALDLLNVGAKKRKRPEGRDYERPALKLSLADVAAVQ